MRRANRQKRQAYEVSPNLQNLSFAREFTVTTVFESDPKTFASGLPHQINVELIKNRIDMIGIH